jgi:pSer/pThr/pTyr-binding forkhead associated (FHA) protein
MGKRQVGHEEDSMPKLTLQFEGRALKEFTVGIVATIGRLPDNTVSIDNPAVSNRHARIVRDGDQFVLEDLKSTNGTFVNDAPVTRHTLKNGDTVLVGKHRIVFEELPGEDLGGAADVAEPSMANMGGTVFLDTRKQKELLAQALASHEAKAEPPPAVAPPAPAPPGPVPTAKISPPTVKAMPKAPAAPAKVGVLQVLAGKADQSEYALKGQTSLIGKSDTALIRLRGWFKPKVAVAIARKGDGYVATLLGGKATINNQPLTGRQDLSEGDVLQVSGLMLEFRMK